MRMRALAAPPVIRRPSIITTTITSITSPSKSPRPSSLIINPSHGGYKVHQRRMCIVVGHVFNHWLKTSEVWGFSMSRTTCRPLVYTVQACHALIRCAQVHCRQVLAEEATVASSGAACRMVCVCILVPMRIHVGLCTCVHRSSLLT